MSDQQVVSIPAPQISQLELHVVGISPLIVHKWSAKAKREILEKQMKKAKTGKEAKKPEQDYEDSMYRMSNGGGCGFPAIGFKLSAVNACRLVDGFPMTSARQMFFVLADEGDLVKIYGEPRMREDMVRVGRGVADIRYRAEFPEWSAKLRIDFDARVISAEQIANLFALAGHSVGIGEWRPEKDGDFGRFRIE